MKKIIILLLITILQTSGQSLLKTFQTNNRNSYPRFGVEANGTLYFTAGQPLEGGVRVWKTDGTDAGTKMINAAVGAPVTGPFPHYASNNAVKAFGNKALIVAAPASQNYDHELWITDGTEAGTFRLADINTGSGDPNIQNLTVLTLNSNTVAFFSANNGTSGQELWMTDGTQAGTVLVKDINPGGGSSDPLSFTVLNNMVYFFANNGTNGHEFWETDGTAAGTVMVKDIMPGSGSSASPFGSNNIIIANDFSLYLSVYDNTFPTNATKLYFSDGTEANTVNMGGYQHVKNFKKFGSRIYFTMNESFTNLLVLDNYSSPFPPTFVNSSEIGNVVNSEDLTISGDSLYLTAEYGTGERRLYLVNQFQPNLAYLVSDLLPGTTANPFPALAQERKFIPTGNGKMYFMASDATHGKELWFTDGNWSNTKMVRDFRLNADNGSYSYMKIFGDKLFFIADTTASVAECYYSQNGNTPVKMSTIDPSKGLSNFYPIEVSGGYLYFSAFDPVRGYELFKTDGSSFILVKDILTDPYSSDNEFFKQSVTLNNNLYFIADDGKYGREVWKTNGKSSQTKIAFEIYRYPSAEKPSGYTTSYSHYKTSTSIELIKKINSKILIFEEYSIWASDGTSAPEKIFVSGNMFSYQNKAYEMNGYLYFNSGNKLYKTNGTAAGTVLVGPPDAGNPDDYRHIRLLGTINNKIIFMGHHSSYGWEAFYSDGTPGNINLLADLAPGINTWETRGNSRIVGNRLYYVQNSETDGTALCVTEGTPATTSIVKIFGQVEECEYLTNFNNTHLVFVVDDGIHGLEIWKSDGSLAGTSMIKDINTSGWSNPLNFQYDKQFAVYDNHLYFYASDGTSSNFYRSDLTEPGTIPLTQNDGNNAMSTPFGVYMSGYTPETGGEPYKIEVDANSKRMLENIASGNASSNPGQMQLMDDKIFFATLTPQLKKELHVYKICQNTAIVSGNQSQSLNTLALDQVISTASLEASTHHLFNAGKSIELLPGFKTGDQTVFETKIEGCVYSTAD